MWRIPITDRIQKFDPDGIFLWGKGSYGSGDGYFSYPNGVAVDGQGNVYVADTDNDRIQKFNSAGGFLLAWGSYGSGNGQFVNPQGVAVDSQGNVYVADTDNNRIQKFNSQGGFLDVWSDYSPGNGQFFQPQGLALGGSTLYVADTVSSRILVLGTPALSPMLHLLLLN